jgi:hypothetical protein
MAAKDERAEPKGEHVGHRYEIAEQIAAGGMGAIYRAHDRLAQREVAYKRLQRGASRARSTALFEREYGTLSSLPHPNIVEVYDYGKDAEGPYYTMELLTGSDLSALAPLPFRNGCRVLRDIASALALVHARRLIHRDVSPNNVRLTSDGRAKLIDFGALTPFGRPKELVGTPAFTAPECVRGGELDQRSDLYSLGAVAYWTLTKQLPVRVRAFEELRESLQLPIEAPSSYVPDLPKELDTLLLSMLAQDPAARPASAAYVIDRLTAIADLPPERDERRVAFSYLAHPPLAGRDDVKRALECAVEEGARGKGQSLLIEGLPGRGRSALLAALVLHAQQSGAVVLRVQADGGGGLFGLARKLLELAFALYPELPSTRDAQEAFAKPLRTHASPVASADRHAALVSAALRVLSEMSTHHPLVLAVDDLHLADPESIALLASLSSGLESSCITLVVTALSDDVHTGDSGLSKIRANSQRLTLAHLDEASMVELVESLFGHVPNTRRLAQWLQAQSAGVPAQALDLARLLLRTGIVNYTLGTFALPHDIDADLGGVSLSSAGVARFADLDDDARRLAQLLCLHEGPLSGEQLAAALEQSASAVLRSLEALKAVGVITSIGTEFTIAGSSVRTALKSTIAAADQQHLHLRLARALYDDPASSSEQRLAGLLHFVDGGAAEQAAERLPMIDSGQLAARWSRLLEGVLEVYAAQGRSSERRLQLLVPLVYSGFYGDLAAQRRHIGEALALGARLCGIALAARLKPYLGGKLALAAGLGVAALRRLLRPKSDRGSPIRERIGEFIGLVIGGAATAASSLDSAAAERYVSWLGPLAALPRGSTPYMLREYCLAIAETSAGNFTQAARRYRALIPTFSKPLPDLPDVMRIPVYLGALNGRAQAEVSSASKATLELADELGRGDPFYAPHAECARVAYYAARGEMDKAEQHRARAELLALQGGTSWSAVTVLTVRLAYGAMFTRDAIRLVQASAELERLANLAPKLRTCKAVCDAWLEALRGRPAHAVELYERVIDSDDARHLSSFRADRILYATALNEARMPERARRIASELLCELATEPPTDGIVAYARQQVAMADAQLGDLVGAAQQLEDLLTTLAPLGNPLQLGVLHRDRARVALLQGDRAAFDDNFEAMTKHFAATRNPSLLQLSDGLLRDAAHQRGQGGARRALRTSAPPEELDASTVDAIDETDQGTTRRSGT